MLGTELNDIRSLPVGFLTIKEMFPVDFEEFCLAVGLPSTVFENIHKCYSERIPVDPYVHDRLMNLFRLYLVVGGMPAAVQKYIDTNNLRIVIDEQRAILDLYRRDIAQYADKNEKLKIREVFDLIPAELNAKNKRFVLKNMNENARFSKYESDFVWLINAGVAISVYNAEELKVPLVFSKSRNLFKLFQNDTGLLACQYDSDLILDIIEGKDNINFGSAYENIAAQELRAHGFDSLFFFNSKKKGGLDFVLEIEGKIVPIEIKSGKDYVRHRALSGVLDDPEYNLDEGIVFCSGNVKVDGKAVYFPIYMIGFLQRKNMGDMYYKVDLGGLK